MAISEEQFKVIVDLIEDGELDGRMMELQHVINERNGRRKDDILKLVRSVWGDDATIINENRVDLREGVTHTVHHPHGDPEQMPKRAPIEYTPSDGPALPQGAPDALSSWPTPIESIGSGSGADMSPVRDPMSEGGGSDPFGDDNPDIVSSGARI